MRHTPLRRGLYAPELLEARIAPATFLVNSLLDDGSDGTLRKEIADANLAPGADTIVFDKALPEDVIVLNTATGEIPITGPLTIKGPGIDKLAISGSDMIRIFNINDGVVATLSATTISGLTLTDGKTAGKGGAIFSNEPLALKNVVIRSSYAALQGGGAYVNTAGKISIVGSRIVHNESSNLDGGLSLLGNAGVTIVKTTIADNTAKSHGGIYAGAQGAKPVILIDTCTLSNNTATGAGGRGGGLFLDGVDDGRIMVKNSLITGNSATGAGGGLYLETGNLLVTKTTFSNNTAASGGAIAIDAAKSLTVAGSRFLGNRATDAAGPGGGALYLLGPTVVKIAGTLFSGNTSAADGGAIANTNALSLAIAGSSFLGNTAANNAGAIKVRDGAVLTMKSSILSGNTAGGAGGAIFATTGSVLNLAGDKFTENRADLGGAIFLTGLVPIAATANLSGNLFQANVANGSGGAVYASLDSVFTSKADKFIGNVALTGQGGGVYLDNSGGIVITGSLFQSNVAGSSGGGLRIDGAATLTSIKVLDNIAGPGGTGGGLRLVGGPIAISKSLVTGNVANNGGGIFANLGTTTLATTIVKGNAAGINPNTSPL